MELPEVARPGLILSQVWPGTRCCEGETLRAIEQVLRARFFSSVHTVDVPSKDERRYIASACAEVDIQLTYCLTRVLTENRLNLADLDEAQRRLAADLARRGLDEAREQGAAKLLLVAGPAPSSEPDRQRGLAQFEKSLISVCLAAADPPRVQVVIEALDVRAHKKCTLGFFQEAADLVRRVSEQFDNLSLCLDTAHLLLNGENPSTCLLAGADVITDFHFCNCVTDSTDALYGDWHLPFGPPGQLDVQEVSELMRLALGAGVLHPQRRPSVYCEVLTRPEDDPLENMKACRRNLEDAWQLACPCTKSPYEDQKESSGLSAESLQHRSDSSHGTGKVAFPGGGQRGE